MLAVITGASRGIGESYAQQLAAQVVAESLAALDRGSAMVITGARNRFFMRVQNLVPQALVRWAASRALKPSGVR